MFNQIWDKQKELMEKFDQIERENGLHEMPKYMPFEIDCKFSQARVKNFAQRVTEELCEATKAFSDGDLELFDEELADAYHFLIELMILCGVKPNDDLPELFKSHETMMGIDREENEPILDEQEVRELTYDVVETLHLATNELKNRPWKKTFKKSSTTSFNFLINATHDAFIRLCIVADLNEQDLYDSYFAKANTNDQRIENNV